MGGRELLTQNIDKFFRSFTIKIKQKNETELDGNIGQGGFFFKWKKLQHVGILIGMIQKRKKF